MENTTGTELVNGLLSPDKKTVFPGKTGGNKFKECHNTTQRGQPCWLKFSKNLDDFMNKHIGSFARCGETIPGQDNPLPLDQHIMFWAKEQDPSNIHLFVTGVQRVRCVMKGSVHAQKDGFKVSVMRTASDGGRNNVTDSWTVCTEKQPHNCNSPAVNCEDSFSLSENPFLGNEPRVKPELVGNNTPDLVCSKNSSDIWMQNIFDGDHGGPIMEDSCSIMENAGLNIICSMQEVEEIIRVDEELLGYIHVQKVTPMQELMVLIQKVIGN